MKLNNLIEGLPEIDIKDIHLDSRKVTPGSLFFAISGNTQKGSTFIPDAISKGAVAIIGDEDLSGLSVPYFQVNDIRKLVPLVASRFFTRKPKYIVAVTGTNGKTSIVSFCAQLFSGLGLKSATIGTIGVISDEYNYDFGTTTPDAIDFHRNLQILSDKGIEAVAFEASSHGIDQHRVDNIPIIAAGFTNLTQDHLDYHKTFANYFTAKKRLFTELLPEDGIAVINADDPYSQNLKTKTTWTYGKNGDQIKLISHNGNEVQISVIASEARQSHPNHFTYQTNIVGDFQIMNSLCALGLVLACGFEKQKVLDLLPTLTPPTGRLEFAGTYNNANIYIDYAHTPDALEKAIQALRPYTKNKLAVLFGCGGDRDKTKRPLMGKIAEQLADIVYITDDNPRTENAATIREEVLTGCPTKGIDAGDRASAIKLAISNLAPGDLLLIAGKGHETYQIIGTEKTHFNDKEEVLQNLSKLCFDS